MGGGHDETSLVLQKRQGWNQRGGTVPTPSGGSQLMVDAAVYLSADPTDKSYAVALASRSALCAILEDNLPHDTMSSCYIIFCGGIMTRAINYVISPFRCRKYLVLLLRHGHRRSVNSS
mmetsp:Transcript_35801/g.41502  ORF Transcript_35801/g.41502 Transcript_35801/m.41502 type:complete len:119 (-) Transcript_35801:430-786(-)